MSIKLLDKFDQGKFLVVEGDVSYGDILKMDNEIMKIVQIVRGNKGRLGIRIEPLECDLRPAEVKVVSVA